MTTFGPQQGPPKVLCLFCHYGYLHSHHGGEVPLLPCSFCWVGVCEACDPTTWFCCCINPDCAQRWGNR